MRRVLGIACVALLAAFTTATTANAKTCEDEVFATGKASLTKVPGAYLSSLWAWRREAEARYGSKYRAWRNADQRNIDCAKGTKDGKSGWICTRTAIPCATDGIVAKIKEKIKPGNDLILPNKTLRRGDRGEDVRTLQLLLNEAGYKVDVDGNYGRGTQKAVRDFQRQEGIGVDGTVGPQTRERFKQLMG